MDEIALLRALASDAEGSEAAARAAALQALEASFERTSAAPSPPPVRKRRRRVLAFAGATAAAAAVAGSILVLGSGPTAESAAAEILHETAAVAASSDAPAPSQPLKPGQFFYGKFKRLALQSWSPGGPGVMTRSRAFKALMPTTQELWISPEGAGRIRQIAGTPRFLTSEERRRWEAAGSPLPAPFDPEYQRKHPHMLRDAVEMRRGVVDVEHGGWRLHPHDTPRFLPEPEAFEHIAKNQRSLGAASDDASSPKSLKGLFRLLVEGSAMAPQRRAAVFNALAEMPGIEVDTDATDFLGRQGDAVRSIDPKTGNGVEFIFDPATSEILAQRQFMGALGKSPDGKGHPVGLTLSETAYLESGVVDSTHETAAEAEAQGPVTTTGLAHRK